MMWRYPWTITGFEFNAKGRDFVAGDIHGEFENLEHALEQLGFDQSQDRLFCVGDLVDRGPSSHRVTEFIKQDWFHSIAGNHEWMLVNCHAVEKLKREFWFPNGGGWWQELAQGMRSEIVSVIESQLYALITIESLAGKVGLVHALPYPYYSWSEFNNRVENDQIIQNWALWERDFEAFTDKRIADVDFIFCGHTPIDKPRAFSNITNIDTGCGHQISPWLTEPALTIVELAQLLQFYRFNT